MSDLGRSLKRLAPPPRLFQSAASGTLLLTAANLANLAAIEPPRVTQPKQLDTASMASSTHFTVVNGLGRPSTAYRKSWCARNQLTVLVCTMSFLFMIGLFAGVLYMESECSPAPRYPLRAPRRPLVPGRYEGQPRPR
jgi:hypothetical protein